VPEHVSRKVTQEVLELVKAYANQGDFGRSTMAKKYPLIDFNGLLADDELMQQLNIKQIANEEAHTADSYKPDAKTRSGNVWTKILEISAYVTFVATVIGGIISAILLADTLGAGIAFVVFLLSVVGALLVLAVIMVFLQMAKDICGTAKDTAEIKELLKK